MNTLLRIARTWYVQQTVITVTVALCLYTDYVPLLVLGLSVGVIDLFFMITAPYVKDKDLSKSTKRILYILYAAASISIGLVTYGLFVFDMQVMIWSIFLCAMMCVALVAQLAVMVRGHSKDLKRKIEEYPTYFLYKKKS